jgi:hypothetical protein
MPYPVELANVAREQLVTVGLVPSTHVLPRGGGQGPGRGRAWRAFDIHVIVRDLDKQTSVHQCALDDVAAN